MTQVADICQYMERLAPTWLAEDWDNVGLLVGNRSAQVQRLMTCLTIIPESCREAIDEDADLIITHHPLPFRPLTRLTADQTSTRMLLDLIRSDVAVFSAHTAFDSAARGINQMLAEKLGLVNPFPLVPVGPDEQTLGAARVAETKSETNLKGFIEQIKQCFGLDVLQFVGESSQSVNRVALACGSGGSFLETSITAGCDTFVTGETNFHTCLEAQAQGVGLVLLGHYTSERFALEALCSEMSSAFPTLHIWASQHENDPILLA